jgi:hypothetical protein
MVYISVKQVSRERDKSTMGIVRMVTTFPRNKIMSSFEDFSFPPHGSPCISNRMIIYRVGGTLRS